MSDFSVKLKNFLGRSAKFIGRTANTTVQATKYKVNEISAMNKRRELVVDLGKKVLELCGNGLVLPEEAATIVEQINQLDAELNTMRADRAAEKAAAAEQHAMEKAARATEKAAAKAAEAIEKSTAPVTSNVPDIEQPVAASAEEAPAPTLELDIDEATVADANTEVPTLNV